MKYNIDFLKLSLLVLPPRLRKKWIFLFLFAALFPFRYLYEKFLSFREDVNERLSIKNQIIYLEKRLNDMFYLTENEIYIIDEAVGGGVTFRKVQEETAAVLRLLAEDKPKVSFHYKDETVETGDFIVYVPDFLNKVDIVQQIKNAVRQYAFAGKRFIIKFY